MDYLVTVWDGGGSVPAELALVRLLGRNGHRVVVLAGPPLREAVEAAGASFRSWQEVPHRRDVADPDPFDDTCTNSPPALVGLLLERLVVGPARTYVREVGAVLDEHRFDALVSSMFMLGAMVAAQARRLPYAVAVPNCYLRPSADLPPPGSGCGPARGPIGRTRNLAMSWGGQRLWDRRLREFNGLRSDLSLKPLRHLFDQHDAAARVLVLTSRSFDFPARLPPNVRYVGPCLDDPVWARPVDAPPGVAPLVLVGMSSTFQNQADLLRRVVAGLSRLPVRAVVTTGPEVDPSEIPAPGTIAVVRSAAHSQLLPYASVVVNHGGHGTVIKSLAAGVPQLVIPIGRDQPGNAARVAAAGVGLRLRRSASPGAIAKAVGVLLREPAFQARAAKLGALVRADVLGAAAVRELESLAEDSPRTQ